jgi:ligand-binding SRPBCC domain-containing protein
MPIIRIKTLIDAKKSIVFDLSRSIDLHKISTQHTNEEAIAGITKGLIALNQSVTWRAKHFGVYQKLSSKITAFDAPNYFVDEMQNGIFKRFKHEHIFETQKNQTLMIDVFDYTAPLGVLGLVADILFLKSYLNSMLIKRNDTIKAFAESERWKEVLT